LYRKQKNVPHKERKVRKKLENNKIWRTLKKQQKKMEWIKVQYPIKERRQTEPKNNRIKTATIKYLQTREKKKKKNM
jgi:surfactin synthase thioesterase subunit